LGSRANEKANQVLVCTAVCGDAEKRRNRTAQLPVHPKKGVSNPNFPPKPGWEAPSALVGGGNKSPLFP